jgi:hypothetical protein
LLQTLALSLDLEWLSQEFATAFHSIGFTQSETLAKDESQVLTNPLDKLRVDYEWHIVDKAMQRN